LFAGADRARLGFDDGKAEWAMGVNGRASALPQELLRRKRLGQVLTTAEIDDFAAGIADGRLDDAQVGAFAMAVCINGMDAAETTALTLAMRDSGQVLDWRAMGFDAPVLDKHSTGGIGDVVTLMLGPMLAACGACVPLLSGRGLGHTGGTLDKLEAIPGYCGVVPIDKLRSVLRAAGVAIVGAGDDLAPADRRLYAIRDVTGTVESIALITASILSKKLAANADALILDIKTGSGAFMPSLAAANELARSLVKVANRAGLPTLALTTDMNQALAPAIGNALETRVAVRYLRGDARPERLHRLTLRLGSELLCLAGMVADVGAGEARLLAALDGGEAAERFARMVAALGGPGDVIDTAGACLPTAPVIAPVYAERAGVVSAIDARALGLAVVALGGGRTRPGAAIDPRVGLDEVAAIGDAVDGERPLAIIHAADAESHARAAAKVRAAFALDAAAIEPALVYQRIGVDDVGQS
jgi:thymidine phosphorylase